MLPAFPAASASLSSHAAPVASASYILTAAATASPSSSPALSAISTSAPLPSAVSPARKMQQQLDSFTVKVLSLPCPSFRSSPSVDWRCEPSPPAASSAVCPALLVPSSLGPVYAGETFRAAVSIASTAEHALYDVVVKLELQSGTRRWLLLETAAAESFAVDGLLSFVVSRPLLESGLHCLAASVSYRLEPAAAAAAALASSSAASASPSSPPLAFSKFFKFNVLQPLNVSCVVHGREGGAGGATEAAGCWAELTVTNSTHRQMRIVHAAIDTADEQPESALASAEDSTQRTEPQAAQQSSSAAPSPSPPQWSATSIDSELDSGHSSEQDAEDAAAADSSSSSLSASLAPSCSRTFVFRLRSPVVDPAAASSSPSAEIGRVSLRWRGAMSELCCLPAAARVVQQQQQRPTASRPTAGLSSSQAVSVVLLSCPARAALERPFTVRLQLVNRSASALSGCCLLLLRDRMGSLLPMGRSRLSIGRLEAGQAAQLQLQLVGIGLGLQRLSGLRVVAQQLQLDVDGLQAMEIIRPAEHDDQQLYDHIRAAA